MEYQEVTDILDLLGRVRTDYVLYVYSKILVETLRKQKPPYSQQQKAAILLKLNNLIDSQLPSPDFIQHRGWAIVCKAELLRIVQGDTRERWQELVDEVKLLPNIGDRAFAMGLVARALWSSDPNKATELFREGKRVADGITSLFEKVDNYCDLASQASVLDSAFSKQCLSEVVPMTMGMPDDGDFSRVQRQVVDLASSINPEFGSHLASLLDNDPARREKTDKAKDQLRLLEVRKKMLDEGVRPNELFTENPSEIPMAAYRNLGALNARRIETVHVKHTREYVKFASGLPMHKAYPIFSWAMENAIQRLHGSKDQAQLELRGIFRATVQGCDLSAWLAAKIAGKMKRTLSRAGDQESLIHAGERERALKKIRDWLESNGDSYLKISDQFVGPDELVEILRTVLSAAPSLIVRVVTSRKYQQSEKLPLPWEETYRLKWRQSSDQDPPETQVLIAGTQNGDSPLHDRWWITKGAGLRLGTSFNSLGLAKDSELSEISPELLASFENDLDACLDLHKKGPNGERVVYMSFNL